MIALHPVASKAEFSLRGKYCCLTSTCYESTDVIKMKSTKWTRCPKCKNAIPQDTSIVPHFDIASGKSKWIHEVCPDLDADSLSARDEEKDNGVDIKEIAKRARLACTTPEEKTGDSLQKITGSTA